MQPCMPPAVIDGVTTEDERPAHQTPDYDNNSISDNDIDDHYSDTPSETSDRCPIGRMKDMRYLENVSYVETTCAYSNIELNRGRET